MKFNQEKKNFFEEKKTETIFFKSKSPKRKFPLSEENMLPIHTIPYRYPRRESDTILDP